MRTTIRLPDELLKQAKRKAAAEGRTLTSLLEEGLRLVIASRTGKAAPRRTLPPVSKATGGLMPGIDPIKIATQTEELDDQDMLRRLAAQNDPA